MILLLDTHALLWWAIDSPRLGQQARAMIASASAAHYSIASPWELAIKVSVGKLGFDVERGMQAFAEAGFGLVSIKPAHLAAVARLPLLHRDPFDRLIVAQALVEGMTIMTADPQLSRYKVDCIGCD